MRLCLFTSDYFGHPHHMHNHYNYRNSRPYPPSITDGFDMMSGGNGYERSDFGVASKWYFNWVSDYNIVSLQPEGKTTACPKCLKSGTFTLKPFDDWWNAPANNDILGVHIPVMSQYDTYWETDVVSCMFTYCIIGGRGRFANFFCRIRHSGLFLLAILSHRRQWASTEWTFRSFSLV